MDHAKIFARTEELCGDAIFKHVAEDVKDPWIEVDPARVHEVLETLRRDPALDMDLLEDLCGVDYLGFKGEEDHLEVVYHLESTRYRHGVVIKVRLPRDLATAEIDSASDIWRAAEWHEREAYDMFGIRFRGHPNLRRIYCPEDWEGYPLRKDYAPAEEYHGIANILDYDRMGEVIEP